MAGTSKAQRLLDVDESGDPGISEPCELVGWVASNISAGEAFLKLYDDNAAPTVGTDLPVIVIPIEGASTVEMSLGTVGVRFANGVGVGATDAAADADTGAMDANQVMVTLFYQN